MLCCCLILRELLRLPIRMSVLLVVCRVIEDLLDESHFDLAARLASLRQHQLGALSTHRISLTA